MRTGQANFKQAVKKYKRPGANLAGEAEYQPENVRPGPVLEITMDYLARHVQLLHSCDKRMSDLTDLCLLVALVCWTMLIPAISKSTTLFETELEVFAKITLYNVSMTCDLWMC